MRLDSNGIAILWSSTRKICSFCYSIEVTQHWFQGHGLVAGQWRYTIYFDANTERPIVHWSIANSVDAAIDKANAWLDAHSEAMNYDKAHANKF